MKKGIVALFIAALTLPAVSCHKESDYILNNNLHPDDIIKITSITPSVALADSSTQIVVRVAVNANVDSAFNVILVSGEGMINGGTDSVEMQVNLSRYADFVLTTGQTAGIVTLHAYVVGLSNIYRTDTVITLAKAYPDSVLVTSNAFTMAQNGTQNIGVHLFCKKGYPSKNQSILFSATDTSGNIIGTFGSTDTFIPGKPLTAQFTPQPNFVGPARLVVYVVKEDGSKIMGASSILVQ